MTSLRERKIGVSVLGHELLVIRLQRILNGTAEPGATLPAAPRSVPRVLSRNAK